VSLPINSVSNRFIAIENRQSQPWPSFNKMIGVGMLGLVALAGVGMAYQNYAAQSNSTFKSDGLSTFNENTPLRQTEFPKILETVEFPKMTLFASKILNRKIMRLEKEEIYEKAWNDYQAGNFENLNWAQKLSFDSRHFINEKVVGVVVNINKKYLSPIVDEIQKDSFYDTTRYRSFMMMESFIGDSERTFDWLKNVCVFFNSNKSSCGKMIKQWRDEKREYEIENKIIFELKMMK